MMSRKLLIIVEFFLNFILNNIIIYRPPKGLVLRPMIPEHGEKINDLWPHKHNGSLYFIQRLIEMNLNIGAFTEDEDELIAWCLR